MDFAIEKDGTQLKKKSSVYSRLSLLLKNNNIQA